MIKAITAYSDSHSIFYNTYFIKSYTKYNSELPLDVYKLNQDCPTGTFYADGWTEMGRSKLKLFNKIVNTSGLEYFIFIDADVQFFGPIKDYCLDQLNNHDIMFQNDFNGGGCTGFFISKVNDKTKNLFKLALNCIDQARDDQRAVNANLNTVSYGFFDSRIFSISMANGQKVWNGEKDVNIPNNILAHHANYTVGIGNKIKLLDFVKKKYFIDKSNNELLRQSTS